MFRQTFVLDAKAYLLITLSPACGLFSGNNENFSTVPFYLAGTIQYNTKIASDLATIMVSTWNKLGAHWQ